MAGLGMGGIAPHGPAATSGAAQTSGLTIGGAALLNYGPGVSAGVGATTLKHHGHQHPYHYRHSLTNRHHVLRTRSSGGTHNIWDEQALEVNTKTIRIKRFFGVYNKCRNSYK